jgi:VIT1/CCC1 family predicted Fe2+/Mn2+ transporter
MAMSRLHLESHVVSRIGWLRASILGANDGIVSTASLIAGVAAAGAASSSILITGVAGLVAGAMSMAAGEYVSVSSQGDAEQADIARETAELDTQPEMEREELVSIYEKRGLQRGLAEQVADALTANNALETHLRDELGLTSEMSARPVQAAFFAGGAALPLAMVPLFPGPSLTWIVSGGSLFFLGILGVVGAKAGGAPVGKAVLRVTFWGAIAMASTAAIGSLFGTTIG